MNRPPFNWCYHCGHTPLEVVNGRHSRCPACGYSQFVTPIPAAVALILDPQGRLLLMRRAHEPGRGKLGLPGGVIEPDEPAEFACAREVREETGIELPPAAYTYLGTCCNHYLFQGHVWPTLDILFVAHAENFDTAQAVDGEASEIVAVPLTEVVVEELAFPTHGEAVGRLRAWISSQRHGH
ncbi:MAG: bifunctional nicotinamide mononucleotide adenylyltransferase/ADP-ribose pyrophosphatase [Verrucomicrobiaceae bacterium]|nr:bifunctional nicotinamide mononucleotide adenylyltransferase/ADP-ribose pyrophosphatase [Verrucomicrobiaceae bacterium]